MYPSIPTTSYLSHSDSALFHRRVHIPPQMQFPDTHLSPVAIQFQSLDHSMPFHLHHSDDRSHHTYSRTPLSHLRLRIHVQILLGLRIVSYSLLSVRFRTIFHMSHFQRRRSTATSNTDPLIARTSFVCGYCF